MKIERADYVIVGGGSAGCVIANRLSEDPDVTVVLLEAGGASEGWLSRMPVGCAKIMANPNYDWSYMTEPDPSLDGRQVMWNAGRMLGGGSGINGMVYTRGARHDFDALEAAGCTGWSWNNVLPYYRKSEDFQGPEDQTHARGGPLSVSPMRIVHPLTHAFVDACGESGLRKVEDYCTGDVDGVFLTLATQKKGQRWSSARAYLGLAEGRPNLRVVTGAMAERLTLQEDRVTGVAYRRHGGPTLTIAATREVIVSAGTIQSPALLMRSGIGPAAELKALGIDIVADRAGVGRNLQEHTSVTNARFVNMPTFNSMTRPLQMIGHAMDYALRGQGMFTTPAIQAHAFLRSDPSLDHPDIKLQFAPLIINSHTRKPHQRPGVMVTCNVSPPKSRGEIRLRSTDAATQPIIDHRHLGHEDDLRAFRVAMRAVDGIFASPALAPYVVERCYPDHDPASDAEWDAFIRARATIGFHMVGTCRMGGDATSVVDPALKVRGVQGLRVADCSILPLMPSANTNAPAMMIGEKAADLVKAEWQAARNAA